MAVSRYLELVLGRRDVLSEAERAAIRAIVVTPLSFAHGETIIEQGPAPDSSCLLVRGMATREHRIGRHERIISALHVPGDFVDLHAFLLAQIDHSVVAQGDCAVEFVNREVLAEISRSQPHLARLLWLCTLVDAKLHRVWIATRARLRTADRIGHLMCELEARLAAIGLAEDGAFAFPLDQKTLADAFGYSAVHVNRAVQDLRGCGLLEWERDRVRLPDPAALAERVGFTADYLELTSKPR
jgi:CRP-like cAMP-binding protein